MAVARRSLEKNKMNRIIAKKTAAGIREIGALTKIIVKLL